jgi:hypothetical protein
LNSAISSTSSRSNVSVAFIPLSNRTYYFNQTSHKGL